MMAHHFDHHFRDMLLREPVSRCETELPSPWALRRKIIIKNRKLPPDDTIKHNICDKDDADDKQFQAGLGKVQIQKSTKKLYSRTKKYKYKRFLKVGVQGRTNLKIILYFTEPWF